MLPLPYTVRLLLLALFIGLILIYDHRHPPGRRLRLREYTFLILAGIAGALFGMAADAVTSSISPEYFIHGKGIPESELKPQALALGAKAGFSATILGAGILLLFNRKKEPMIRLARLSMTAFLASAAVAALFGAVQHFYPLVHFQDVGEALEAGRAHRFTAVWCIHLGIYAGGGLGFLVACWKLWR